MLFKSVRFYAASILLFLTRHHNNNKNNIHSSIVSPANQSTDYQTKSRVLLLHTTKMLHIINQSWLNINIEQQQI